jgi:ornithine decarboxylase
LHQHHSALAVASLTKPADPVTLLRPHAAARAARFFVEHFPGTSLYAVKANPSPDLLRVLWDSGITHYDVASISEVRLVARTLPEATLCFMHPVKAEEAIAEAYFTHGVRTFSPWMNCKRSSALRTLPKI